MGLTVIRINRYRLGVNKLKQVDISGSLALIDLAPGVNKGLNGFGLRGRQTFKRVCDVIDLKEF